VIGDYSELEESIMDYAAYEITITAIVRGDEGPNGTEHRPNVMAYVDVSNGRPIVFHERRTGAPGVSTTEAWDGLDLTQIAAALPRVSAAESAPPSIEAPQQERHRERRVCPACGRKIEVKADGKFVRHDKTRSGGVPCGQTEPTRMSTRNKWPKAPLDVLQQFETKYGGSYIELGKAHRVPTNIANNWVRSARAKAARRNAQQGELAALPIRDPRYMSAPADILEQFATRFHSSYDELVAAYGISKVKAYTWVNDARKRAKREREKEAAQGNAEAAPTEEAKQEQEQEEEQADHD
jgi:hypothetical protein